MENLMIRTVVVAATATIWAWPLGAAAGNVQSEAAAQAAGGIEASRADTPAEHLRQARELLNQILTVPVSGVALARMSELRTAYIDLERAWAGAAGERMSGTPAWAEHHATIERAVSELLAMAARDAASGTEAVGTSGRGTSGAADDSIDTVTAKRLREFQLHVRAFNDAALAAAPLPNVTTSTTPTPTADASSRTSPLPPAEKTPTRADRATPAPSSESAADMRALLDEIEALLNDLLPSPGTNDPNMASSVSVTVDRERLEQLLGRVAEVRGRIR
jgi:hypothetical protein